MVIEQQYILLVAYGGMNNITGKYTPIYTQNEDPCILIDTGDVTFHVLSVKERNAMGIDEYCNNLYKNSKQESLLKQIYTYKPTKFVVLGRRIFDPNLLGQIVETSPTDSSPQFCLSDTIS